MTPNLNEIFADSTYWQLSALVGLALFFLLAAIRELRDECAEGYLYLVIAIFLGVGHAVMLENALSCDPPIPFLANLDFWKWLVVLAAPPLIVLFIVRAIVSFVMAAGREALVKLFFGLTLLCFLYMVGTDWPSDVRGMLTIVWVGFLFKTEMAITN
jgi:hypothetical protein